MKKILVMFLTVLFLAACSSEDEPKAKENEQDNYEVLTEKDYGIEVYDSDDLNITLNKSRHEREESVKDWMKLMFTIKNKTDKTFEFYFEDIQLDGDTYKVTDISSTDTEIKPSGELEVIAVVDSLKEINFEEFIAVKLIYSDYEKNRSVAEFNTYINE